VITVAGEMLRNDPSAKSVAAVWFNGLYKASNPRAIRLGNPTSMVGPTR
jgi:hypothetical protein